MGVGGLGSEVRERPVGQRHRASFKLSHHNGERDWAAARVAPLGTRNAVASTHRVSFCRPDARQRQALLQRYPMRPQARPRPNWKDRTEFCDYVRVSAPKFWCPFRPGFPPTCSATFCERRL